MKETVYIPTIHSVAEEAGVSIATVSRVINGATNVKPETAKKVHVAIQKTGYEKTAINRTNTEEPSRIIGFMCADLTSPMLMEVLQLLEEHLRLYDYSVMVMNTNEDPDIERRQLKMMAERNVDAIIAYSTGRNEELLYDLQNSGIPILLVDRRPREYNISAVYADKGYGMYEALEYLIRDLEHHEIGIITADPGLPTNEDRERGLKKFFKDHPEYDNVHLFREHGTFTREFGYEAAGRLMVKGVSAIIACSQKICAGVMEYCKQTGVKIPEDVSVISFGTFTLASLIEPALTYIGDRNKDIALTMIEWVSQVVRNGNYREMNKVFLPRLIIGASCEKHKDVCE